MSLDGVATSPTLMVPVPKQISLGTTTVMVVLDFSVPLMVDLLPFTSKNITLHLESFGPGLQLFRLVPVRVMLVPGLALEGETEVRVGGKDVGPGPPVPFTQGRSATNDGLATAKTKVRFPPAFFSCWRNVP